MNVSLIGGKRMGKTILIGCAIFLITAGHVLGNWPPTNGAEIVPKNPISSDVVIITLSGYWSNSCIPIGSEVSVTGNDVFFDVLVVDPAIVCLPYCCPSWQQTKSVGPLSRGTYTVHTCRSLETFPPSPPLPLEPYTQITEFIVSGKPDIDEDGDVDFVDFSIFSQAWKAQPDDDNWNSSCNISEPNDAIINERDLAVIVNNWLEDIPGMTFQIGECTVGAVLMPAPSPESDELRFSVIVQGRYIHFEDMMAANCCSDELYLDMTVEDNLITIYENEHTTMPCPCLCDYPVTSTLGPFEPDTYVLEVYEDTNGFIGSTIVIVE
jgi:hypothetical protein